jgi:hypothetical protein
MAIALLCAGCETGYHPKSFSGGYEDQPLGGDKYAVSFQGNGFTSMASVMNYALRRAREVCLEHGFAEFEIIDGVQNTNNAVFASCSGGTCNGGEVQHHEVSRVVQCHH